MKRFLDRLAAEPVINTATWERYLLLAQDVPGVTVSMVLVPSKDLPGALTLVAQVNAQGEPEIAVKNVTDATHLDRTPRMKLVDAVDAEASNRASLLFELRAQNSRQFALYRVIGARAEQTFLTGSTQ